MPYPAYPSLPFPALLSSLKCVGSFPGHRTPTYVSASPQCISLRLPILGGSDESSCGRLCVRKARQNRRAMTIVGAVWGHPDGVDQNSAKNGSDLYVIGRWLKQTWKFGPFWTHKWCNFWCLMSMELQVDRDGLGLVEWQGSQMLEGQVSRDACVDAVTGDPDRMTRGSKKSLHHPGWLKL